VNEIATALQNPSALALDAANIYFGRNNAGTIYSVPIAGGTATPLVTNGVLSSTDDLLLVGPDLYIATDNGGSVLKAPKTGGTAVAVGSATVVYGLGSNGVDVFWTDHYQPTPRIGRLLLADAGTTFVVTGANIVYPTQVAADQTYIYWGNAGTTGTDGAVWRAKLDGTQQVRIANGLGPVYAVAIDSTAQATTVYFGCASGIVGKVAANSSGTATPTTIKPNVYVLSMVADAKGAYWLDRSTFEVGHVAAGSSTPETFVSQQTINTLDIKVGGNPQSIKMDATHVYWTDFGSSFGQGAILSVTRD
jgi:hypothetical protein